MSIGRFDIEQLSEGFFELFKDGTFSKMDPNRLNNPMEDDSLGRYSSALGIDPLLITDGETNLVIDPGLGWGLDNRSSYKETSNIVTNLNIFGLRPQDIHYVISPISITITLPGHLSYPRNTKPLQLFPTLSI